MAPKARVFLTAVCASLFLDQATKWWISTHMSFHDRITVIDGFFYITHVRNPGAAFGLFTGGPELVRLSFFIGVTLVAVAIIVQFYRHLAPGDRYSALTLGLILGGALGNLIDRVRYKEVVDFLHFRLWSGYAWPDFNLADSFIVVGVAMLLLELLASEAENRGESADAESGS